MQIGDKVRISNGEKLLRKDNQDLDNLKNRLGDLFFLEEHKIINTKIYGGIWASMKFPGLWFELDINLPDKIFQHSLIPINKD